MDQNPYEAPREANAKPPESVPVPINDWKQLFIYGIFMAAASRCIFVTILAFGRGHTTDPLLILTLGLGYFGFPIGLIAALIGGIGWMLTRRITSR